jgi:ring-1,2-phenylacetyl-CoA epoxidase subunit PaaD
MIMPLSSKDAWQVLAEVNDPEIPGLSIVDLGIVRGVEVEGDTLRVRLTPTYSGCPALKGIEQEVASALRNRGFQSVVVETALSPAWSSDQISDTGRRKLKQAGIAPPEALSPVQPASSSLADGAICCPFCGSTRTVIRSEFGSTACKSLRYCNDCLQPFEHFKSI